MIFTVNPTYSALDEKNGLFSNMFSTHPPIEGRLDVLLDMAHSAVELVVKDIERQAQRPRTDVPEVGTSSAKWVAHKDGAWQGPFNLTEMMTLGWMRLDTWVPTPWRKESSTGLSGQGRPPHCVESGAYECPKCQHPKTRMMRMFYTEVYRVEVDKCFACGLIWFDGDELEVLQYLIEHSLDKSRS